jgi:hypothetical protein
MNIEDNAIIEDALQNRGDLEALLQNTLHGVTNRIAEQLRRAQHEKQREVLVAHCLISVTMAK